MADQQLVIGGVTPLADKIRASYPGAYADMDDYQLTQAVIKKYPQYHDLALPYDAQIKRDGKMIPVRLTDLPGDERLHAYEYHPPDPEFAKHTYEGAKAGIMAGTAPLALGASLAELAGGTVGGALAGKAGQKIAERAGAGEFGQEVAGDVAGVAGGIVGAGVGAVTKPLMSAAARGTGRIVGNAARAASELGKDTVAQDVVGAVSPRAVHAQRVLAKVASWLAPEQAKPIFPTEAVGPPTPPPEVLHPELVSEARTLPGQISPERVAPQVRAQGAAPLPARTGLALPAPQPPPALGPSRTLPGQIAPEVIRPRAATIPPRSGLALPAPQEATPAPGRNADFPRSLSGDSALRQLLTGQDNLNLLRIARSRGVNVTQESVLKPGKADNLIINKIIDSFSPEELEGVAAQYMENTRFRHSFGDIGPEAWKTLSLKSYFPELKIPQAMLRRTQIAVEFAAKRLPPAVAPQGDDLSPLLQESLRRVQQTKAMQ